MQEKNTLMFSRIKVGKLLDKEIKIKIFGEKINPT